MPPEQRIPDARPAPPDGRDRGDGPRHREPAAAPRTGSESASRFGLLSRTASRAAIVVLAVVLLGGPAGCAARRPAATAPEPGFTKRISFSVLEDYDKGEDLAQVARDFALMKELGVTTWRGSFGWDDYESAPGRYDFAWLHAFADLAAQNGIMLRPYIGYTPSWAGIGGNDNVSWNDPPAALNAWQSFVYTLVREMRRHPNVLSYEIYNEENAPQWWDGTNAQYGQVLRQGAEAIRAADPRAQILMGGLVFPDADWMAQTCAVPGIAASFDIVPFHAYPETWTPDNVFVENYLDARYRDEFLPAVDGPCRGKPIWINEAGYATTPGRTERDQAGWWARAVATFLADPRIEHIGIYEIKDLPSGRPAIGDTPNYHLGITRADRTPKLAFRTLRLLTALLGTGTITVADAALSVTVTQGREGQPFRHLFVRPDGGQVLLVWDKSGDPVLDIGVARPGTAAVEYALDGTPSAYAPFDGRTLRNVRLAPGAVRIFQIKP